MKGPMCTWGMKATDALGEGLVKKETYWVTNSRFIARELEQECTNKTGGIDTCTSSTTKRTPRASIHLRLSQQSFEDSGNNSGAQVR